MADASEPPWPIGTATNCKRVGWRHFFLGRPPDRPELNHGYQEGWDAAEEKARG